MTQQTQGTTTETQGTKQGQGAKKQGTELATTGAKKKTERKPREKKERPQRETPAHMPKVDRQAASLPPMSQDVQTLHAAANNMSTADMISLIAHLNIAVRRRGVQQAAALNEQGKNNPSRQLEPGARVTVLTCQTNPRLIGMQGTVSKVQRIRCYVELDGREYTEKEDAKGNKYKGDYFFTSDVAPVSAKQGDLRSSLAETVQRLTNQAMPSSIEAMMDEQEEDATGTHG